MNPKQAQELALDGPGWAQDGPRTITWMAQDGPRCHNDHHLDGPGWAQDCTVGSQGDQGESR